MVWIDEDGDFLEVKEVFGFGRRMLFVRTSQEGEETQVNMDEGQAKAIVEFLQHWLRPSDTSGLR